ncbi:glycosyltransferase family 4 protein [Ancylobacter sp. SL191]|uniref:glycosyltransferase family 4 protein n=1 Tax=Ancylobacter sp. SL191 TaxID=2995166 RepID=UPI0022700789|nr:glycosyltransferase family 4 protein [Ancylobacter sp. SL191]WAC27123.1 glycosyltransferase family 4 protein [Ancylobacter sp. SL191]
MTGFAFAIPGDITLPTGGYAYDRRILAEIRRAGGDASHLALPGGFPFPTDDALRESAARLCARPVGEPVLIDGLALGAMPAALLRGLGRPLAALVHHPLALEAGLDGPTQARFVASERAALAEVDAVIVTSPATAELLARDYDVLRERITVAVPGTDPAPRSTGTGTPLRLLAVGAVIPRKAYGVLVDALATLADVDWSCAIVGALDRDPAEARAVQGAIEAHGLAGRVRLAGALDEAALAAEFHAADLFVCSSLFEGYGMGLTEAIARGLPVVATEGGAIPQTLPPGTAILAPPADAARLAAALRRAMATPALRRELADTAWAAAQRLPRWPDSAALILKIMQEIAR